MKSQMTVELMYADICGYLQHVNRDCEDAKRAWLQWKAFCEWMLELEHPAILNPVVEFANATKAAKRMFAERN